MKIMFYSGIFMILKGNSVVQVSLKLGVKSYNCVVRKSEHRARHFQTYKTGKALIS